MIGALLATLLVLMQAPPPQPPPLLADPAQPQAPLPVLATNAMGGRVFRIPAGLAFDSIAPALRPGDELVLERGIHAAFTLTDLRGERDRPIIIRGEPGEEPARFPYVKATDFGIRLVRPQFVILRDLMVGNGRGPLVLVEGGRGPDGQLHQANLQVASLRLLQDQVSPEQDGVVLRDIDRVDVREVAVRGWNRDAFRIERSSRCSVNYCVLDPGKGLPQETGVTVTQGCRQVALGMLTLGPKVRTGFRLGSCEGLPPETPPATGVMVMRCSVPEADRFAWIGGVDGLLLQWNTVTDPGRCVWEAEDACGLPRQVVMAHNLFAWTPGAIEQLCRVPATLPRESIQLGPNLWWSAEIPAAFEAIGRPFGVEVEPQVLDVDPRVEPRFASPLEPRAKVFGWQAPDPAAAGPAVPPPTAPSERPR